jgi:uncharacterized protein YsxB (DUF464 family)
LIVVTLSKLRLSIEGHAVGGKGAQWMRACAAVSAVAVMLKPRAIRKVTPGSAAFDLYRHAGPRHQLSELDARALATLRLLARRYPRHVKIKVTT